MKRSILLSLFVLATLLLVAVWGFVRLHPRLDERQNFNPDLGSGQAQFERFVPPGSFTSEESRLYIEHGIGTSTYDTPR